MRRPRSRALRVLSAGNRFQNFSLVTIKQMVKDHTWREFERPRKDLTELLSDVQRNTHRSCRLSDWGVRFISGFHWLLTYRWPSLLFGSVPTLFRAQPVQQPLGQGLFGHFSSAQPKKVEPLLARLSLKCSKTTARGSLIKAEPRQENNCL